VRAFTLFATHYFELTALADDPARASPTCTWTPPSTATARVPARGQGRPGQPQLRPAVAQLAGVPRPVIGAARRYLAELELFRLKELLAGR
jgi:DNA mismatch repair protein MutS